MNILVTGAAGFIGFHLSSKLLDRGFKVIGVDNVNDYYDISLKKARLALLDSKSNDNNWEFYKTSLESFDSLNNLFKTYKPDFVVNLAAQAGVRHSIERPNSYFQSNLVGFGNILECCRHNSVKHLIYASSSSVYGGNTQMPFSEKQSVDHPVSLYAASKRANELMAHSYSHLYDLPTTGLRFFTVYGPWGRPDMALFLFTKAILAQKTIKIFNQGKMIRDFTYIDDIIESLLRLVDKPPSRNNNFNTLAPVPDSSWAPYKIFNIGNSKPTPLMDYITALEKSLGQISKKEFLPMQPGDVQATSSDTSELENWINFKPNTSIDVGVQKFVEWYKKFY